MSVLADRASGAGVLDRLQVLRSAPTPLRGAPAATWPPSPRTGVRQLRVAGPGLQPWLQDTITTRTDPAGSTLATPVLGPRNGVHLRGHASTSTARSLTAAYTARVGDKRSLNKFFGYTLVLIGGASLVLPFTEGSRGWTLVGFLAGGLTFMVIGFWGATRR